MPRPKKNGEKISLYLDRDIMDNLRVYADEKGQTLTTAMERLLKAALEAEQKGDSQP